MYWRIKWQSLFSTNITVEVPAIWSVWNAMDEFAIQVSNQLSINSWWVVLDFALPIKRDLIFFHRRDWDVIYYYRKNRDLLNTWAINQVHFAWSQLAIHDFANWINWLSDNTDDFGYMEKIDDNKLLVYWWDYVYNNKSVVVEDAEVTLNSDWVNYIYFDYDTELFNSTLNLSTANGDVVGRVNVSSANITSIVRTSTANKWPQWITWDNWRDIQLEKWSTHIRWRYVWDTTWNDLVAIQDLQWEPWEKWDPWEQWIPWEQWVPWASVVGWEFQWDDLVFTKSDLSTIVIEDAKILLKWDTWDIWEPWPWGQHLEDIILPPAWSSIFVDEVNEFIRVTYPNWTGRIYTTSGYWDFDVNLQIISVVEVTWTWETDRIQYPSFYVRKTDWAQVLDWQLAFRNQSNIFSQLNNFLWDVSFGKRVSFPYHPYANNSLTVDAFLWTKHKLTFTTWWTKELVFTNVNPWANYVVAIANESWWNITLNLSSITNSWSINTFYVIWNTNYPLTLDEWIHLFVCETFDSAIHVSYTGKSSPL